MKSKRDMPLMLLSRLVLLGGLITPWNLATADKEVRTETKEKEVTLTAQIVLVAVGPKAPRRFKNTGTHTSSVMLLPEPGEVPPSRLYFKAQPSTDEKPNWQTFNVAFNNPSVMKSITPEKTLTLYQKNTESGEYLKYVTIPPGAEGGRRVFFLIPSATGPKPWEQPPLVRTIDLDSKTLQGKQFILKNLSQFTVLHAFEKSVTEVPSMKTISYTRPRTGELYRLAARYGTQKKIIYNTAVRLDTSGNIQLFALYNANPKTNSGRSVGVFRMMIPVKADTSVK